MRQNRVKSAHIDGRSVRTKAKFNYRYLISQFSLHLRSIKKKILDYNDTSSVFIHTDYLTYVCIFNKNISVFIRPHFIKFEVVFQYIPATYLSTYEYNELISSMLVRNSAYINSFLGCVFHLTRMCASF